MIFFLFNRTTLQGFVTYLTGALYVHRLWFYKHKHDNPVRSKLSVACQPIHRSGKCWFKNSLTCQWKWKFLDPSVQLSQVCCVWQVVKTPTIIPNNPVLGAGEWSTSGTFSFKSNSDISGHGFAHKEWIQGFFWGKPSAVTSFFFLAIFDTS
jgi:hypothetical protein